jgi:hypothetical protein
MRIVIHNTMSSTNANSLILSTIDASILILSKVGFGTCQTRDTWLDIIGSPTSYQLTYLEPGHKDHLAPCMVLGRLDLEDQGEGSWSHYCSVPVNYVICLKRCAPLVFGYYPKGELVSSHKL